MPPAVDVEFGAVHARRRLPREPGGYHPVLTIVFD